MKKTLKFEVTFRHVNDGDEIAEQAIYEELNRLQYSLKKEHESLSVDLISTTNESACMYPKMGAGYIRRVTVKFNGNLDEKEQRTARAAAEYWGSLPFVGKHYGSRFLNDYTMEVYVDCRESNSKNITKHNILELLENYLNNGTPERVTQNYTRAVEPVGFRVSSIVGNRS